MILTAFFFVPSKLEKKSTNERARLLERLSDLELRTLVLFPDSQDRRVFIMSAQRRTKGN